MKQVLQNFKTGELNVEEVPAPAMREGGVLVRNRFSLISAGTERSTVEVAQSSLVGKAQKRPDLVRQAIENVRREGVVATYNKVMNRLEALKALGYSCAGEVVETGCPEVFQIGARVACAGAEFANHAEYVYVPKNLCARIPDNVAFEEATYSTLGAIALQGVRQADPKIGDWVAVIGLGLLGQLTIQILEANGCNAVGIDLDADHVALAVKSGATAAYQRAEANLEMKLYELTSGHGFDAIIITAAAKSNDPIELSGLLARKKGRIVVVGAVNLDVPRSPFYEKELEVRMSCSYGPGRYDKQYEVQGIDYPFGFVRWTEKRNLEAFLQLLAKGRIQVESLTTHRFDVAHAADAYDLILGRANEKYLGVLLEYPGGNGKMPATKIHSFHSNGKMPAAGPRVGFIGAGNFAQTYLLPNVKKISGVELVGVANLNGPSAKSVGDKFGFRYCTTDYQEIIADENIDVIFIATRHDLHAPIAIAALRAGKSVFVEKPPALNSEQLRDLMQAYSDAATSAKEHAPRFAVGYNRRHTPLAVEIKKLFENVASPLAVNYRINAGFLDRSHWLHDPQAGGGRIVGELCHFVDLAQYFIGSLPISVYAEALSSANDEPAMQDNVAVLLKFQNGGVAVITYLANGSSKMPKERIEIFGGGVCAAIDNFTGGIYFSASKAQKITKKGKGYFEEVQAFGEGQEVGSSIECFYPSATTFAILESLRTQSPQNVTLP